MLCDKCTKNQATIHLTEIVEGKRSETHLCQDCAQKQGVGTKTQIPLNELLNSLLAASEIAPESINSSSFSDSSEPLTCPQCGLSWDDFKAKSLLGCPNDYNVFEPQLLSILQKAHCGQIEHRGKIPSKTPESSKKQIELVRLRKELQDAVNTERYEIAAKLKQDIEKLENGIETNL